MAIMKCVNAQYLLMFNPDAEFVWQLLKSPYRGTGVTPGSTCHLTHRCPLQSLCPKRWRIYWPMLHDFAKTVGTVALTGKAEMKVSFLYHTMDLSYASQDCPLRQAPPLQCLEPMEL